MSTPAYESQVELRPTGLIAQLGWVAIGFLYALAFGWLHFIFKAKGPLIPPLSRQWKAANWLLQALDKNFRWFVASAVCLIAAAVVIGISFTEQSGYYPLGLTLGAIFQVVITRFIRLLRDGLNPALESKQQSAEKRFRLGPPF